MSEIEVRCRTRTLALDIVKETLLGWVDVVFESEGVCVGQSEGG